MISIHGNTANQIFLTYFLYDKYFVRYIISILHTLHTNVSPASYLWLLWKSSFSFSSRTRYYHFYLKKHKLHVSATFSPKWNFWSYGESKTNLAAKNAGVVLVRIFNYCSYIDRGLFFGPCQCHVKCCIRYVTRNKPAYLVLSS